MNEWISLSFSYSHFTATNVLSLEHFKKRSTDDGRYFSLTPCEVCQSEGVLYVVLLLENKFPPSYPHTYSVSYQEGATGTIPSFPQSHNYEKKYVCSELCSHMLALRSIT